MARHSVCAFNVHRNELLPRACSMEHPVWIVGRSLLLCVDCESPQLSADADQRGCNSPLYRRVN